MNQNKFSFESENLVVDYISFKFQHLDNFTQTKITNYLFKLEFNSYQESGKLAKPIKESILVSSKNKFEVLFVGDNSYWQGDCTSVFWIQRQDFLQPYQTRISFLETFFFCNSWAI